MYGGRESSSDHQSEKQSAVRLSADRSVQGVQNSCEFAQPSTDSRVILNTARTSIHSARKYPISIHFDYNFLKAELSPKIFKKVFVSQKTKNLVCN